MAAVNTVLVVATVATCYGGHFVGQPLRFGEIYSEATEPWVALPVSQLGVTWNPHDLIYLSWGNGDALLARAKDTGPIGRYYVEQWGHTRIGVDVPCHLWPVAGISAPVNLYNVSAAARKAGTW